MWNLKNRTVFDTSSSFHTKTSWKILNAWWFVFWHFIKQFFVMFLNNKLEYFWIVPNTYIKLYWKRWRFNWVDLRAPSDRHPVVDQLMYSSLHEHVFFFFLFETLDLWVLISSKYMPNIPMRPNYFPTYLKNNSIRIGRLNAQSGHLKNHHFINCADHLYVLFVQHWTE